MARVADVPDGGAVTRDLVEGDARFSVLLCRLGAQVFAYENRCPHAGFPLERLDGRVITDGAFVLCAAHGASFRIVDGVCSGGPGAQRGLTPVLVTVSSGDILAA